MLWRVCRKSGVAVSGSLAHGGVYVAGGIATKLLSQLQGGAFMRGFLNKGRYRGLLETIPVYGVKEARVGLQGAQQLALRMVDV